MPALSPEASRLAARLFPFLSKRVRALAPAGSDRDALADLITDTVTEAVEGWDAARGAAEKTFAEAILRRKLQRRLGAGELARPEQEPRAKPGEDSPLELVADSQGVGGGLWEVLPEGLPEEERRYLELIYEGGCTQADAAAAVGWAPSGAATRHRRLLERLRPQLAEVA